MYYILGMLIIMLGLKLKWASVIPRFWINLSHTDGWIDGQEYPKFRNAAR